MNLTIGDAKIELEAEAETDKVHGFVAYLVYPKGAPSPDICETCGAQQMSEPWPYYLIGGSLHARCPGHAEGLAVGIALKFRVPIPSPPVDTRTPEWVHWRAVRLRDEGHNVEDVAHLITIHGHPVSSRTVRRHLKDVCGCEEAKPKSPPTAPLPVAPSQPDGQAGQP